MTVIVTMKSGDKWMARSRFASTVREDIDTYRKHEPTGGPLCPLDLDGIPHRTIYLDAMSVESVADDGY